MPGSPDATTPIDGQIDKLTCTIEPPKQTKDEKKKPMEAYRTAQDANRRQACHEKR